MVKQASGHSWPNEQLSGYMCSLLYGQWVVDTSTLEPYRHFTSLQACIEWAMRADCSQNTYICSRLRMSHLNLLNEFLLILYDSFSLPCFLTSKLSQFRTSGAGAQRTFLLNLCITITEKYVNSLQIKLVDILYSCMRNLCLPGSLGSKWREFGVISKWQEMFENSGVKHTVVSSPTKWT